MFRNDTVSNTNPLMFMGLRWVMTADWQVMIADWQMMIADWQVVIVDWQVTIADWRDD